MAEITPSALKSNELPSVKSPTNTPSLETITVLQKSSLFSKGKQAALVRTFDNHPHHCLSTSSVNWPQSHLDSKEHSQRWQMAFTQKSPWKGKKILSSFKSEHILTSNGGINLPSLFSVGFPLVWNTSFQSEPSP